MPWTFLISFFIKLEIKLWHTCTLHCLYCHNRYLWYKRLAHILQLIIKLWGQLHFKLFPEMSEMFCIFTINKKIDTCQSAKPIISPYTDFIVHEPQTLHQNWLRFLIFWNFLAENIVNMCRVKTKMRGFGPIWSHMIGFYKVILVIYNCNFTITVTVHV